MLKAALASCLTQVADLEKVIEFHESFRAESMSSTASPWAKGAMALLPEDKKLRRLEAAMIVGALYAAWEKYIESAMAEVVDLILRVSPFTSLDVGFQERYRRGFSHVLGKNETRRFSHL
jgi:hypothetical protein